MQKRKMKKRDCNLPELSRRRSEMGRHPFSELREAVRL